ncbi:MAG: hypothetical protein ACNA8W_00930 [Bradymonadaceae bacterium]
MELEGELLHNLEVFAEEDEMEAFFNLETELSDDERRWLEDEELFIVVYTQDFPDGELRAQLTEDPIVDPVDEFEVQLAGEEPVIDPPVE